MPIYTDKLVHYHLPRTGGTWVERALRGAGLSVWTEDQHAAPDQAPPGSPAPGSEKNIRMTFLRHPLHWLRSWYAWQVEHRWQGMSGPSVLLEECRADTFETFVTRVMALHPGAVSDLFHRYQAKTQFVGVTELANVSLSIALHRAGVTDGQIHCAVMAAPCANATPAKTLAMFAWPDGLIEQFIKIEASAFYDWQRAMEDVAEMYAGALRGSRYAA